MENPSAVSRIVAQAVENLIQHKLWDAAFELIQRFSAEDVLIELLKAASDDLLAAGRTPTLRSWIPMLPTLSQSCSSSRRNLRSERATSTERKHYRL